MPYGHSTPGRHDCEAGRPPMATTHQQARHGETDHGNLVSLCRTHHRAVHEQGWRSTSLMALPWSNRRPDERATGSDPFVESSRRSPSN
jgi:hypothetical protein